MPDDLLTTARRGAALGAIPPDVADRLIDEVDRLRAENAEIRRDLQHEVGWAIAIISSVDAPEAGWPNQADEWRTAARQFFDFTRGSAGEQDAPNATATVIDRAVKQLRLRADNLALAEALCDIAGMLCFVRDGRDVWVADADCSCMHGLKRCHESWPDTPEDWCPVCVAEVAWCAWKLGTLG